jgi:hypothetical protein
VVEAFEGLVEVVGLEIVTEALGSEQQAEQSYRGMGEEGQVFAPARLAIQSILRDRMRKVGMWAIGEAFVYLSEPICGSRKRKRTSAAKAAIPLVELCGTAEAVPLSTT